MSLLCQTKVPGLPFLNYIYYLVSYIFSIHFMLVYQFKKIKPPQYSICILTKISMNEKPNNCWYTSILSKLCVCKNITSLNLHYSIYKIFIDQRATQANAHDDQSYPLLFDNFSFGFQKGSTDNAGRCTRPYIKRRVCALTHTCNSRQLHGQPMTNECLLLVLLLTLDEDNGNRHSSIWELPNSHGKATRNSVS